MSVQPASHDAVEDAVDPVDAISWPPSPRVRMAEHLASAALDPGAPTARLEHLVREAAASTGADHAQISMMTDRLVVVGIESNPDTAATAPVQAGFAMPFEDSMCVLALRENAAVTITDAGADPRSSSLPAVTSGQVGAYLGSPIRSAGGEVLGALCVYGSSPRSWSDTDQTQLARLAGEVGDELGRIAGPVPE